jgi:pimeloyl-ACP methyl ester carboxylesterase
MTILRVGGIDLSYELTGSGPPVLLVCGTGMSAAMWSVLLAPPLHAAGYSTLAFDNRGIPPSAVPSPPYTVDEMADDAIGLLDALGIERCAVAGASLGALITQRLARRRPDVVAAAVLIVGGGMFSEAGAVTVRAFVDALQAGGLTQRLLEALMLPSLVPAPVWHDDDAVRSSLFLAQAFDPPDARGLLGQYQAGLAWNDEDRDAELREIDVPVLALPAEHDPQFPASRVRRAVSQAPRGEVVDIPGATHIAVAPEHQDLISTSVVDFLARTYPPSR